MNKIKITAGLIWAVVCLILMIILYFGLGNFSSGLSKLPFMKINPNFTGGEVAREIVMESCTLAIRKPVFDGLIGEKKNGFVQLDWRGKVPETINDTIDYNMDNTPDFVIIINRKEPTTMLTPLSPEVKNVEISTETSFGWAVRVNIYK